MKAKPKSAIQTALKTKDKHARYNLVAAAKKSTVAALVPAALSKENPKEAEKIEEDVKAAFELLQYNLMREMILSDKIRIDGRNMTTVRPISVEAGLLPRTHGSSLFTRGETQVLSTVTLGTSDDEQIVDHYVPELYEEVHAPLQFPSL